MHSLTSGQTTGRGFVRSAFMLFACIAAVSLLLLIYAMRQTGSAGPAGVAAAAAICLFSGLASEGLAHLFSGAGTPLTALLGMAARMLPPLVICLILAAQGSSGRQHLAFVCYLLAFYLVTLTLETWLAVKRVHRASPDLNRGIQ